MDHSCSSSSDTPAEVVQWLGLTSSKALADGEGAAPVASTGDDAMFDGFEGEPVVEP